VPTVAVVDGVKISVYARPHPPSHFHAKIAEREAVFNIATLEIERGFIPLAKKRKVLQWAQSRKSELTRAFDQARAKQHVDPID
jgi:Domain of unknown function (DUF4160)